MARMINMLGEKCGRYTVIARAYRKNDTRAYWECICECGEKSIVLGRNLRNGSSKSCGCLRNERAKETNTKHGDSKRSGIERLYHTYKSMMQRCTNPNVWNYNNYGGRGITVCDQWQDYEEFKKWAHETGYSDNLSIDRINNDGNYEPSNCRWATNGEQANNTRRNIYVVIDGEKRTVAEWSRLLGVDAKKVYSRIARGWDIDSKLFM